MEEDPLQRKPECKVDPVLDTLLGKLQLPSQEHDAQFRRVVERVTGRICNKDCADFGCKVREVLNQFGENEMNTPGRRKVYDKHLEAAIAEHAPAPEAA